MKVNVKIPKDKANDEAYRHPVEVFVDGQFIARVKWVNGPPYYSVEAVDEIPPRGSDRDRLAVEVERLKTERDAARAEIAQLRELLGEIAAELRTSRDVHLNARIAGGISRIGAANECARFTSLIDRIDAALAEKDGARRSRIDAEIGGKVGAE